MTRKACTLVWIDPEECDAPHGLDMSNPHDFNKVEALREDFIKEGFNKDYPALVGYPLNGRIQLLSGTHRHLAAKQAGIKLPVTLWLRSDVEETWGTDWWDKTIQDIPVKELECFKVKDGSHRSPYPPIVLGELEEEYAQKQVREALDEIYDEELSHLDFLPEEE